ncbi:MAG TPA: hypothetical protein VKB88_15260 [Bryobacteraceae bacterium]|nr:hypothetical protein [Bryobacteraceae bacterium]
MNEFRAQMSSISAGILFLCAACGAAGQTLNTVTRVDSNPSGAYFFVDGVSYYGETNATWPAYSSHTLSVPSGGPQTLGQLNVQAVFSGWKWTGGGASGSPQITVVADPNITEYTANFSVSYAVTVDCGSASGGVFANGGQVACGTQAFFPQGQKVVFTATPADGYVFAGWMGGPNQSVQGTTDVVTLNAPVQITPLFQVGRQVNILTVPTNLHLLVDGGDVLAPYQALWGQGSVHSIYPESPQQDVLGTWWVCPPSACAVQNYTVPGASTPFTVTMTYEPGVPMGFYTSPAGLSLTLDNRSNWTSYSFIWGVGDTHTVSAPAQQTDATGHVWAFSGWSNGGAATQTITVPQVAGGVKYVATYTPMGQLTVTSPISGLTVTVNGSACTTPCNVIQAPGTQLDVSAPASIAVNSVSRQDFLGWSNGAGPGDLLLTLGTDPVTVSANYHLMNYLATASNPTGGASLTMQPSSPDGYYDSASSVSVSATPQPGYKFRAWTGDLSGSAPSGLVAMSAPRAIQANLDKVPYVPPSAVANGAGGTAGNGVAPGSVISIFGANLTAGTVLGPSDILAQTLGGVTVRIGTRLLPLFFVSPSQINAQLPADFAPGQQTLTVSASGQPDVQATFNIVPDAPGLFGQSLNGQTTAVAFHAGGTPITASSPAQQGETVTVYGTGFGASTPARPEGLPVPSSPQLVLTDPASVAVDGATFTATSALAVPGTIGVDAIQFVLGAGTSSGQLTVTINGQQSNTVVLPLAPSQN